MSEVEQRCPRCKSTVRPIVYGYPTSETFEAAERGEVRLGGCIVGNDDPDWSCSQCDWQGSLPSATRR